MIREFRQGQNEMRDNIIAMLIGLQNKQGNDVDSEEYKAYQTVMNSIEEQYGKFMSR